MQDITVESAMQVAGKPDRRSYSKHQISTTANWDIPSFVVTSVLRQLAVLYRVGSMYSFSYARIQATKLFWFSITIP